MASDEDPAGRARELLAELTDFDERNHEAAINAGATEMDFTGSPMRGMVIVPADRLRDRGDVEQWVVQAIDHARSEPPRKTAR